MLNRPGFVGIAVVLAACAGQPQPAPSTPGAAPAAAAGPPGSIGVACRAIAAGYKDYGTTTFATNLDICSVGGDGMLTLAVKGRGADGVSLHLAGFHGAGSYPLTGASTFTLSNSVPEAGRSQTTQNCAASRCSVEVIDASAGAAAGTPHDLDFAVTCTQLCDVDTHVCTATPSGGGAATWSFRAAGCGGVR